MHQNPMDLRKPHPLLDQRARHRLIQIAKYPANTYSGSQYPCKQEDIDYYQHLSLPRPDRFSNTAALFSAFDWFMTKKPDAIALDAFRRLRHAMRSLDVEPDLMIKAMPDIDSAFFNFALRGHVVVHWTRNKDVNLAGYTRRRGGAAEVCLNADSMYARPDPSDGTWETLFHELVVSAAVHKATSEVYDTNWMCSMLSCISPPATEPVALICVWAGVTAMGGCSAGFSISSIDDLKNTLDLVYFVRSQTLVFASFVLPAQTFCQLNSPRNISA